MGVEAAGKDRDEDEEGAGRGLQDDGEGGEKRGNDGEVGGDDSEWEDGGVRGLFRKVWMGDEKVGWQRRRLEREREELGRGKGYGDIIMEQVREVFPRFGGGRGRGGEDGDGDGGEEGGG